MIDYIRNHHWTWPLLAALVVGPAAYGAGRYASPTKVVFQTVTEFREVSAKQTTKGPVVATRHTETVLLPGGGRKIVSDLTLTRGPVVTLETRATEAKQESVTTKTWDAPRLTLAATIGMGFGSNTMQPAYGLLVGYRFAGPLTGVVQGEGNAVGGSARLGLGITF